MQKSIKGILCLCLSVTMLLDAIPSTLIAYADSTLGGGSNAEQISVQLLIGDNVPSDLAEQVNMPKGDKVDAGTRIGDLTSPELAGYVFDGWYYDAECKEYAYPNDEITDGAKLYASFTDRRITGDEDDLQGNYTATMDLKDKNFKFKVTTIPPMPKENDLPVFLNPDTDNVATDGIVIPNYSAEDIQNLVILRDQYEDARIRSVVTQLDDNTFEIAAEEGFVPGTVYQLDVSEAEGVYIVAEGETQPKSVIYHNMSIFREEVVSMELEDDIIFIPADDVENLGELEPLMTADVVDLGDVPEGMSKLEEAIANGAKDSLVTKEASRVEREGSFVYKAAGNKLPKVGDKVCIYRGTSPQESAADVNNLLNEDEGSYMVIDRIEDNYTFYYHMADPMDIVDVPIVVPMSNQADMEPNDGNRLTLAEDALTFNANSSLPFMMNWSSVTYGSLQLDENSKVEVGDFIALYTVEDGNVSEANMNSPKIVRITDITMTDDTEAPKQLVIGYTASSIEEVQSKLQVHATQEYDVPQSFVDEHKDEVERLAAEEFEEADKTPLLMGALKDEKVTAELAEQGIDLSTTLAIDENNQLLNGDMLDFDAMGLDFSSDEKLLDGTNKTDKVKVELKKLSFKPEFYRDLKHFKRSGVGFTAEFRGQIEVSILNFTFSKKIGEDSKREGQGKVVVDFSLAVTQEVYIDQNVDIDIDWWFCIPVDLIANVSIDVGSWSNFKGALNISTGYEDDALNWGEIKVSDSMKQYEDTLKKISTDIMPKLKEFKEYAEWDQKTSQGDYIPWEADDKSIVEHIIGDDDDPVPTANTLSDFEKAYKKIVDSVGDTWMPLVKIVLLEAKPNYMHLVELKLEIGFTLSVCGTIEIGAEFNYDYVRRYNAHFDLADCDATTSTTDIQKPHSQFSLYAIGVFGLKPALYLELSVGAISTDLDSIGIMVEAGFEFVLYLYGYLNIDNLRQESVQFQGGVFFDMRFVLDISLGAQIGKGAFSTSKTIYDLTIPLISLGTRYQIRGLAEATGKEDKDGNPLYNVKDTLEESITLATKTGHYVDIPKEERMIFALDMRSGDVVPYIPEADEFTYETISDNQLFVPTTAQINAGIKGKGIITNYESLGEKYEASKIFLDNTEQDFDKVKSFERIYLDFDQTKQMPYYTVDVKMTYKIPGGVLVRGKTYYKILHITVDQSTLGHYVGFQADYFAKPVRHHIGTDENISGMYYMPETALIDEHLLEKRADPHIVGYTFKGWQPFKLGFEDYIVSQWRRVDKVLNGEIINHSWMWVDKTCIRRAWVPADNSYIPEAIHPEDGKTEPWLWENIQFEMIAEPNPQKIHVRHYLLNPDGDGYELVGENDALSYYSEGDKQNIVSDAEISMATLKKWGAFKAFDDTDSALVDRGTYSMKIANVKVTKDIYGEKTTYMMTDKNGVTATVTPADNEIANDIVDIYYTSRRSYPIVYQAVDENGNLITNRPYSTVLEFSDNFTNGCPCSLRDIKSISHELVGYEFTGWYDTNDFDSLTSKEGDKPNEKRMPARNVVVQFKVKSVPMYVPVTVNCSEHQHKIASAYIESFGGDYFTMEELLEKDCCYAENLAIADLITEDRSFVTPMDTVFRIGGLRTWYQNTITLGATESSARPDNLNIRVVFTESLDKQMTEGEEYVYATLDFGTTDGCGSALSDPNDAEFGADTKHPEGYWLDGFSCNVENGPYCNSHQPYPYYLIPAFMPSHLENSDWTEYDAATNTLTYIYRSNLRAMSHQITINHLLIDENGFKTNYSPTITSGFSEQVIEMFPQYYYEVPGCETDYEKTPESFVVQSEGDTVIDYYLKEAYYPFNFVVKDPATGEVLYTSKTYSKAAHDTFVLPEELTLANEKLNLPGYRFLGWAHTEKNEWITQEYMSSGRPSTASMKMRVTSNTCGTYEAVFEKTDVKVTLYWDDYNRLKVKDGQYKTLSGKYDVETGYSSASAVRTLKAHTDFTLPTPAMYDGAVFLGWYDNPDFTGEPITGTQQIVENAVYYARIIHAFPVRFVGNADAADPCDYSKTVTQSYDQPYVFPQYNPTRTHYTFLGWSTEADGEVNITETTKASNEITTLYAVWGNAEYTISFDLDGGAWSIAEPLKHIYNVSNTSIPTEIPTKTGYRFVGWQRAGSEEVKQPADITFGKTDLSWSITLYAVWEPVTYRITYHAQGGTMPEGAVSEWSFEKSASITAVPTKADALFRGWYEAAEPSAEDVRVRRIDSTHAAGDVTLYAKWSYQEYPISAVRYSSDGQSINPVEADIPETYQVTDADFTLPTLPSDDVWAFDHWEVIGTDDKATTVTKLEFSKYSGKIELHAVYNKITYSITYNFNDGIAGTGTYPASASYGETVRIPIPTRSGYHFAGWQSEEIGKISTSFEMTVKKAVTLKAIWKTESGEDAETEAQYQLRYYVSDGNGGWTLSHTDDAKTTYDTMLYYGGMRGSYTPDTNVYQFDHISLADDDTEYGYLDDITITAKTLNTFNVYYSYQDYTVHFMMEHGSVQEFKTVTLHYNDVITQPATNPTKDGYTFNGWDFTFDNTKTVATVFGEQNEYYIYSKEWTQKRYPITYVNWPEGDVNPNPAYYTADTSDFALILPYRYGYTAKEQIVEVSGKEEPITVTIEWELNRYEIHYDLQGGKVLSPLTEEYTIMTAERGLPIPLKEGYVFDGWTIGDSDVKATSVPCTDTLVSYSLKANWKPLTYTILYNLNGGTPTYGKVEDLITEYTYEDVLKGKYYDLLSFDKEGCTFDGWDVFVLSTNEHYQLGNAQMLRLPQPGSDLYITAVFNLTECKITYDMNDGSDTLHPATNPNSVTMFNPSSDGTLTIAAPYRTGYDFDGWTCDQKLGAVAAGNLMQSVTLDSTNAMPAITLTAHWKAKPYYITYNLNGGNLVTTTQIKTTKNASGELVPETGTVLNPLVYSILNSITVEDPTRTDGIAFLGWTSEQFYDLQTYTECELSTEDAKAAASYQPVSSEGVVKLLNAAPKENFAPHYENLKEMGIVLNAVWADKDYPIYYDLNGGTLPEGASNPDSYTNLTESFTLTNPVRTGYIFLGWRVIGSEELQTEVTVEKGSYGELALEAVWAIGKYTITYELYGGTLVSADGALTEYTTEDAVIPLGTAFRSNSIFAKWTVQNADTGETLYDSVISNGAIIVPRENPCNLLIIANWNSEKGTAYADPDGGEWVNALAAGPILTYPMDTGATILLSDPVKKGYDFMGWENCSDFEVQVTEAEEAGCHNIVIPAGTDSRGIQLKAIWQANQNTEYKVSWFVKRPTDEDYLYQDSKVYIGTAWEELSAEQRKAFESLVEDAVLSKVAIDNMTITAEDAIIISGDETTEIYLYFQPNVHTVNFEYGYPCGYLLGEKIEKPEDPERFGYIFDGWFADEACTEPFDFTNAVMGTEDITVYSKWSANTQVIEYLNWPEEIENPNPTTYIPGADDFYVTYPTLDPDATGYDCGDLTDDDLVNYTHILIGSNTGKITVETPWQLHAFTITYNCPTEFEYEFDGTKVESYNFKESAQLPTLSAIGHEFLGWMAETKNGALTLTENCIPTGTKGDVTLTAMFDTYSYSITYHGLEDSSFAGANPNPAFYSTSDTPFILQTPTKDGYTFNGWAEGEGSVFNPYTVEEATTGDLVLTAKWTPIMYTIQVDGETVVNYDIEMTRSENGVVLTPDNLDGFTFNHWDVTDESGNPITIGTDNKLPAGTFGNLTAVPNYDENVYTISYVLNDGEKAENETYPETYKPSEITIIPAPVKAGCYFTGWLMEDAQGYQTMLTDSAINGDFGNVTLYAGWEDLMSNVTLYDANYDRIASGSFAVGADITLEALQKLLPNGYTFAEILTESGDALTASDAITVEDGWYYSFTVVKGYAKVTLIATDGTKTDIANLYGDDTYMYGAMVYVSAFGADGYRFEGWYDDDTFTNCLSTDTSYEFTAEADVTLYAKYTAESGVLVQISSIGGGEYLVGSEVDAKTGSTESVFLGDTLTLSAVDTEHFCKWEDGNGKLLGTEPTLTITIRHDMQIVLITTPDVNEQLTYVAFCGPYDQTLGNAIYGAGDSLDNYPTLPAMLGYQFLYWSLDGETEATTEEIEALFGKQTSVTITAVYEKTTETNSITVYVDGTEDASLSNSAVPMGGNLALTAPTVEGRQFLYWSLDADGSSVYSYQTSCNVKSVADIAIYAIYCGAEETPSIEAKPTMMVLTMISETLGEGTDEQHKVAVAVSRDVTDDYALLEYGMLYYKDGTVGTEENMVLENAEVLKYIASNMENSGTLTLHFDMTSNEDCDVYARGYLIVMNTTTGNIEIYYTDIVFGNYDEKGE